MHYLQVAGVDVFARVRVRVGTRQCYKTARASARLYGVLHCCVDMGSASSQCIDGWYQPSKVVTVCVWGAGT
jgi:hypothetical protein